MDNEGFLKAYELIDCYHFKTNNILQRKPIAPHLVYGTDQSNLGVGSALCDPDRQHL